MIVLFASAIINLDTIVIYICMFIFVNIYYHVHIH